MGREIRPLYLFQAQPHHIDALKAAKASLGVEFMVKPVSAGPGDKRVLSFAGRPPFICQWRAVESRDVVQDRMKWALGLDNRGGEDYAQWLTATLGAPVREVRE